MTMLNETIISLLEQLGETHRAAANDACERQDAHDCYRHIKEYFSYMSKAGAMTRRLSSRFN